MVASSPQPSRTRRASAADFAKLDAAAHLIADRRWKIPATARLAHRADSNDPKNSRL